MAELSIEEQSISLEDLLALGADMRVEIVEGEIVEVALGRQLPHQYRRGSSTIRIYQKPEEAIDTGDLFPGLDDLTVAAIFKLPKWAEQQR